MERDEIYGCVLVLYDISNPNQFLLAGLLVKLGAFRTTLSNHDPLFPSPTTCISHK